jgi:multiple sugar transport system substrate-binding protein
MGSGQDNTMTRSHLVSRRAALKVGAAVVGATALPAISAGAADDVPMADVNPPAYEVEKGAVLSVMRPAKFIDPDELYWRTNTKKFTDATGIDVHLDFVNFEDLRPKIAVLANTGAGPDIVCGWSLDPHIYALKLIEMTDLAEYLGAKYGGWYDLAMLYGRKWKTKDWISIPIGGGLGPVNYRISWVKEAGYERIPGNHRGFMDLCQKLQKIGHPCGLTVGHAVGDANNNCHWALWSHGGFVVDENGKVALDSKETIAALKYMAELYKTMIPGTLAWNDASNNKAYAAGEIGLTFNGVSIYYVLKNSPDPVLRAIADDTQHQTLPLGLAKRPPQTAGGMNAMLFRHSKYPNAAKEYLRFMMEADQYGPWLSSCLGYWSQTLRSYERMKFWTEDPKLAAFIGAMDSEFYYGYKGPMGAAATAVSANWTVVDMFAAVATGDATPEEAAKRAAQQAARYYRV